KEEFREMTVIKSYKHELYTVTINKLALNAKDDKRIVLENKIDTVPYGYKNEAKSDILDELNKLGNFDIIITFNEGSQGRIKVLNDLGIKLGQNCVYTLRQIDEDRVRKAEKAGEEETKQARKRARMVRKKLIDDDKAKEQDYEAGMF
ncbi:hypothetical protein J6590_106568, partial [Homalodisca vitripennis]